MRYARQLLFLFKKKIFQRQDLNIKNINTKPVPTLETKFPLISKVEPPTNTFVLKNI